MRWPRQPDIDRFWSRVIDSLYLFYLWCFARPLTRVEKLEIRTPLKPDCGLNVTIWKRNGHWYFWMVTEKVGGFPEDWKAPESSNVISPAMYIDVLQRYIALTGYVERLNTGEQEPGTFMLVEDLTPHPSGDIKVPGE